MEYRQDNTWTLRYSVACSSSRQSRPTCVDILLGGAWHPPRCLPPPSAADRRNTPRRQDSTPSNQNTTSRSSRRRLRHKSWRCAHPPAQSRSRSVTGRRIHLRRSRLAWGAVLDLKGKRNTPRMYGVETYPRLSTRIDLDTACLLLSWWMLVVVSNSWRQVGSLL